MSDRRFPRAYRWLILKTLTDWEPWHFLDDANSIRTPPDILRSEYFQREFQIETGADYEVYLFARRQDREDFAFFVLGPNGQIEDSVVSWHLTFSGRRETFVKEPFQRPAPDEQLKLLDWIRNEAIPDVEDWISMDDDDRG